MDYRRICVVIVLFLLVNIQLNAQKQNAIILKQMGPRNVITYVLNESTAERMGLKSGDIILSINGKEILSDTSFYKQIKSAKGSEIEIEVWRKCKMMTFKSPFNEDKLGIFTVFYEKDKLLSSEEMKEDLDTLFSAICEIHPNPYFNISKQEFDVLKMEAYNKINNPMSINDFWKLTARIVARLGDGYTSISMPYKEWLLQNYYNGKIIFPLELHIIKDIAFVRKNLSDSPIKNGDYILSINGISIRRIMDDFSPYISGELRHFKIAIIERYFSPMLYLIYGFKGPFNVKIKDSKGKIKEYTLEGVDKNAYDKMKSNLLDHNFHFNEIPELKTSIIKFNNFEMKNEFDKFLENSFTKIKERKYRYLIIDLRNNGGGHSGIAEDLLNYITDKPYCFFGGARVKVSKYTLRNAQKELSNENLSIDSIYSFKSTAKSPPKNSLGFKGKIFILISNYTFSTASGFASVIKDFEIGTLMGEETGGLPTCYGDACRVTLANSELTTGISWKYFIRPNGDTTYVHHGVMPDVYVKTTIEDLHRDIDPVMENVKEIIRKDLAK